MRIGRWGELLCALGVGTSIVTGVACHAQLVGTRDATIGEPLSDEAKKIPGRNGMICKPPDVLASMDFSHQAKTLTVTIVKVEPLPGKDGEQVVTVKLMNEGKEVLFIPWKDSPVEPQTVEPSSPLPAGEEMTAYLSGHLSLELRGTGEQVPLNPEMQTWAQPRDQFYRYGVGPGEWVIAVLPMKVPCRAGDTDAVCGKYLRGEPVKLVATWWEQTVSQEYSGKECTEGQFTTREVSSDGFDLVRPQAAK